MANVRKTPNGNWSLTVRHKLLPKPIYRTFEDERSASSYGQQLDSLLQAGIVPDEFKEKPTYSAVLLMSSVIQGWIDSGHPARSDIELLELLLKEEGALPLDKFNYEWCEGWVRRLKLDKNLAPGTIRKRVGSLSRAFDWWLRSHQNFTAGNPLKLLPKGASTYKPADVIAIAKLASSGQDEHVGKRAKQDISRERRFAPGEEERILSALRGEKREDRERSLQRHDGDALRVLFLVIVNTGARLREAYMLRRSQCDMDRKTLLLRCSKQWHGRVTWREVPMMPKLYAELTLWLKNVPDLPDAVVFPCWDGGDEEPNLKRTSNKLSARFATAFEYAACQGLTEHDLRHEATCRWYEMRDPTGNWVFREAEIHKIMGWKPGSKIALRYASFRAEDLAKRLWQIALQRRLSFTDLPPLDVPVPS